MLDNCYHSFTISTMGRAATSRSKIEKTHTTERTDHDMVNKIYRRTRAPNVFCYPDSWKS